MESKNDVAEHSAAPHCSPVEATWTVELNCHCPHCGEYVDLLDDGDFWDGRNLDIAEHGTERSKGVEVWCPECGESFEVNLSY